MFEAEDPVAQPAPRRTRRGRPPRITRERIVDVAKTMDPSALTMKAVAAELGVDPSAVNYHVSDRETLRELVAAEVVDAHLASTAVPADADWREALRTVVRRLREALVLGGSQSAYFRLPTGTATRALALVDDVQARLVEAGLSAAEATRTITAANMIAFSSAREAVVTADGRVHPQKTELLRALTETAPGKLANARAAIEHWAPETVEQFEYALDLIVAGVETRLAGGGRPAKR
ncbi:TetR/AcrR family transcriptional regulator C-terminal domain-containing protein [Georgenia sp. TF02-10]|uniref:TetR/AcrR family transcriptional regulator C-terminal domain-containing protein n=1 Tax=Georgenia sp. TF02-10 TaxID=2917725 RepID=UPI001FA776D0|nr:TetR/AcrR family transcriptional regulator C-terminal domain-containing protein [Georgenia sp. TF02-10]UNX54645.1 TetR/AcrR family transcriptional regulator C-terminal domain-containing protein [Georgenia sp. TF02-10]